MSVHVSVVVPTFRRPDLLNRCIAALLAQDYDASAFEIIIADDAASDETRRQIEWWGMRTASAAGAPSIFYVAVSETQGPAAARNAGWRQASGEIIAFTDDDCIPMPDWLRQGVAAFDEGIDGAMGKLIVPMPSDPTDYERDAGGLSRSEFVTANCFYRRSALEAVGGFDEQFTSAWREDSDLFFNLLESDRALAVAPAAIVVHPVRQGPWGISVLQQRKSMFNALLYKKHPELYRDRIQNAPPMHYYATVLSFLLGVAGLALEVTWLAGAGFGAWLFGTLSFCAMRLAGTRHTISHVSEMILTSVVIPPLAIYWRIRGAIRYRVLFL